MTVAAELRSILRPDVAFLLHAAGRMLDGARLYVDVVEINPPLILWINLPVVAAARSLHLPEPLVYRLAVLVLQAAALWVSGVLLRRLIPQRTGLRHGLLLLGAVVLFPMAGVDFGEREHLMIALVLPYVWLVALRVHGAPLPVLPATMIGVAAGLGIALKPHFLLGWMALELYRRRAAGRLSSPTHESLAVLGVLLVYAVSVLVFAPRYLSLALALGPAYARFLQAPIGELLLSAPGLALMLALLAWIALRQRARERTLWEVLLVASAAFFVAGLLQLKGLRYHFYPSFGLATLALGGLVLDVRGPLRHLSERVYRTVAAAAVIASATLVTGTALERAIRGGWGAREDAPFDRLVDVVRRHAEGGAIFVFSYNIGSSFPLVSYAGVESASRFPQLWILAAEYIDRLRAAKPLRYREPHEMSTAERYLNEAVLADLVRGRPRLLLVLRNARDDRVNGLRRFDYLGYFGRDPRFARVFSRYELLEEIGEYAVYRRIGAGESRSAPAPTATPGTLDVRLGGTGASGVRLGGEALGFVVLFVLALLGLAAREKREQTG